MNTPDFIDILLEVIKLHREAKIYNTAFVFFEYELVEQHGALILRTYYPTRNDVIEISNSTESFDDIDAMIFNVKEFINTKRNVSYPSLAAPHAASFK